MEVNKLSIVDWAFDNTPSRCGYCNGADCSYSNGMWAKQLTADDYQSLIDRGWRRSGKYCYKPIMDITCCPLYTIRCDSVNFKASKSQRKVIKKFNRYLKDGLMPASGPEDCLARDANVVGGQRPAMDVSPGEQLVMGDQVELEVKKPEQSGTVEPQVVRGKGVKKGLGADPSKPPCKKAKLLRMERKKQKAGAAATAKPLQQNEKNLEDLFADEEKGKLKIALVCTGDLDEEWERTKEAEFQVYRKYQKTIHDDEVNMKGFVRFLVSSPIITQRAEGSDVKYGSYHQQYWLGDKLVAVGVIDILPRCVSSVYFFYDPDYRNLTLGTYGSLRELSFTRSLNKSLPSVRHYYMGYYNHACPKMRYKGKLSASDLLCPETYTWHRIEACLPKLDAQKYSRLAGEDAVDEDDCSEADIKLFKILYNCRIYYFGNTSYDRRMSECFKLVGALCGRKCVATLIIVDPQR